MTAAPDDSAAPFLNDEYFMRAALRLAETAAENTERRHRARRTSRHDSRGVRSRRLET